MSSIDGNVMDLHGIEVEIANRQKENFEVAARGPAYTVNRDVGRVGFMIRHFELEGSTVAVNLLGLKDNAIVYDFGFGDGTTLKSIKKLRSNEGLETRVLGIGAFKYHPFHLNEDEYLIHGIESPQKILEITGYNYRPDAILSTMSHMHTKGHSGAFLFEALQILNSSADGLSGYLSVDEFNADPVIVGMDAQCHLVIENSEYLEQYLRAYNVKFRIEYRSDKYCPEFKTIARVALFKTQEIPSILPYQIKLASGPRVRGITNYYYIMEFLPLEDM